MKRNEMTNLDSRSAAIHDDFGENPLLCTFCI